MANVVEIKEIVKRLYGKYDAYINPVLKFLLAMTVFLVINGKLGYMTRLNSFLVVLVAALLGSFLPLIMTAILAGLFILLHLYALTPECALVAGVVIFLMFLLYMRLVPKETLVILLAPILFMLKIPYALPLVMGLLGTPLSIVSVAFGVILAYLIEFINANGTAIVTIDDGNMVSRIRFIVDGMLMNKGMYITIVAFAITLVLVYTLRRRDIDHAWSVATIAGAIVDVIILLISDLMFDLNFSIVGMIFGSIVAVAFCIVLQIFSFHLDYTNTENVQFEDDDYYYYVKAVPKVSVSAPEKKVKKINTVRTTPRHISSEVSKKTGVKTVRTANGTTRTIKK